MNETATQECPSCGVELSVYCSHCGQEFDSVVKCERDHCSPEERRVIDAALAEESARRAYYDSIQVHNWSVSGELLKKLGAGIVAREMAVSELLATRSTPEAGE